MIVKEGGVSSIMAAYNQVGVAGGSALHSTQNAHLLNDILRTDFGFKGFVLSDWWAMPNGNSVPYPANSTLQPTALQAVQAGLDMELPWRYNYSTLTNLVSGGQLTSADLATSTARILEQKMRFKVDKMSGAIGLRQPFTTYNSNSQHRQERSDAIRPSGPATSTSPQRAAEESMVLLKNSTNTLPIPATAKKIAVVGAKVNYSLQSTVSQDACNSGASGSINCTLDFTTNVRTGDCGSSRVFSDPAKSVGPLAGIMAAASTHGATVTAANSASAAAGADFVVVIAGLTPQDEGEEYTGAGDRTSGDTKSHAVALGLDPKQNSGTPGRPHQGRRGARQAVRGGARRRQRHRHLRLVRQRAGGCHGLVPGHGRRQGARQAALRRRGSSGKLPHHLGRHPQPLAAVRGQLRYHDDGLLPRVPVLRKTGHGAHASDRQLPLRLRVVVLDLQLLEPRRSPARRLRRMASSRSPSTSRTRVRCPPRRPCCCSRASRARRCRPARAATKS